MKRSLFERCYRAVMVLYPRRFRDRFGDEMLAFANDRRAAAAKRGPLAAARESTSLIVDLVQSAPGQWTHSAASRNDDEGHLIPSGDLLPRDNMDILIQDLRFGARGLLRRKGFTIVAALTLALGIGANTAIFSVVNALLIRPLPYPNADRMVMIYGTQGSQGQQGIVYPDYREWRAQNRTFDDMGAFRPQSVNLTGRETPDRLIGMFVSASFMRLIGATPEQGRAFTDAETEVETKAPVAMLAHEAWETRFGSDPSILGKTVTLNGQPLTVVGIVRPGIQTPYGAADAYLPMGYYPNAHGLDRGARGVAALGTLKQGVSFENAQRDLAALAKRQEEMFPATNKGFGVELQSLKDQIVGPTRTPLYIVFAAVGMVLLIACANVANLQLARGAARHRELSVRAALGAGRGRIAQQLLTESVLLSLLGGAAGVGIAIVGTKWLAKVLVAQLAIDPGIRLDGIALAFAFVVSVVSGILFGMVPAWKASRADVHEMLRSRSGAMGHGHARTRNTLVVVQLALSLALLSCAGLLTRSLIELQRVNTGFDTDNLMTMQFRLPASKYDTPEKIWGMFDRTIKEIRAVPGVKSAALVRAFPMTGNGDVLPIEIEGRPAAKPGDAPTSLVNPVTTDYFATMGIPRLAGRDIAESDNAQSVPVMVVNKTLAAKTWPNESAIGKRMKFAGDDRWWTVVGVVGDSKHFSLNERQLFQAYIPHAQRPQIFTTLALRSTGDPLRLTRAIRDAIWRVDRDQPVWGVRSMNQLLDGAVGSPKLIVRLTVGFAVVALLLGAIGIYGVLSYTMSQRSQEIGIRIALGAESRQVVRMVVGEGLRIVAIAVAIGLAGSLATTRLLRSQLFGVGPTDVLTFSIVTALLALVAMLACWIPARRASRVDPMLALRSD
jgi:putative ABC transport system permease protein